MRKIVIILASGSGMRMKSLIPKQYIILKNGLSIIDTIISRFIEEKSFFDLFLVVINRNYQDFWDNQKYVKTSCIKFCYGGKDRAESIRNALIALQGFVSNKDWIFVHDAVRVCLSINDLKRLYRSIIKSKSIGGILAVKATDSIKLTKDSGKIILKSLDRSNIYMAQTPQVFQYKTLLSAYYFCFYRNILVSDESSAVEALDYKPIIVEGSYTNIKVTHSNDLNFVNNLLFLDR